MSKKLVSFVVLNWNGLDDTLLCLDSIRKQTYKNYEIIVVDNGSSADQKDALRAVKDIALIDLPENTGFTGGQIAAYQQSGGDYIALINNDSVIARDWCELALDTLRNESRASVVGGRAYEWNETKDEKPFSTSNQFYSYQIVNPKTAHTKTLRSGDHQGRVNSISGSAVMIKRSAIEKVGYFEDRFFAYYEESDLFARMKRAGYEILYNPSLHTWHKIAQSTRSNPSFYLYYMHRNRFLFALRNFDTRFMLSFLAHYYGKEWLRAAGHLIKRRKSADIEQRMLFRAGIWNLVHIYQTLKSRGEIRSRGTSYSDTLLHDLAEPVTVIIPCYNYEEYVGKSIESVLHQSVPAHEIIVVDDGSTDKSLGVIDKYKDRVTVISKKNEGVIATKNLGITLAKTDWIMFLDADDIIEKDYLAELTAKQRFDDSDVVYCGMQFFGNEDGIFTSRPFSEYSILKGNYINNSALLRKQKAEEVGGYNKDMGSGYEDWEFYVNLSKHKSRFSFVNKPLLRYRRHGESSRDIAAQKKLHEVRRSIRKLHPQLFSTKHQLQDILVSLVDIRKRRTPFQVIRDIRYKFVKKLDNLSKHSRLLEKSLATSGLLSKGEFSKIGEKARLNVRRLKRKVGK